MNIGSKRLIVYASIVSSILLLLLVSQHMAFAATQVQVQPQSASTVYPYKTIPLFTNQTVQPNSGLYSQFIKVQNYHELALFVSCNCGSDKNSDIVVVSGAFSIDGVNDYYVSVNTVNNPLYNILPVEIDGGGHTSSSVNITAPYFRANIANQLPTPQTVTVTLYLIP